MNFFGNGSCGEHCGFGGGNCSWIIILLLLCSCGNCCGGMGSVDVCTLIILLLLLSACGCQSNNC